MYEIDEKNNTITVISQKYLDNYWESNYEKEEIKSLTADEVLFIIQDSIRIYQKYEKIILQGYESKVKYGYISSTSEFDRRYPKSDDYVWDGDETEKFWRVPFLETQNITAIDGYALEGRSLSIPSSSAVEPVLTDIYSIIFYRIEVLSSPKVFVQGAELLKLAGENPEEYSGVMPDVVYYCAGMTENEQREKFISRYMQQYYKSATVSLDDMDVVAMMGDYYVSRRIVKKSNLTINIAKSFIMTDSEEIFLTEQIKQDTIDYLNNTFSINYSSSPIKVILIPKTQKFFISFNRDAASGTYAYKGEMIVMISGDVVYYLNPAEINGEECAMLFKNLTPLGILNRKPVASIKT
jgi:hypothetical protein